MVKKPFLSVLIGLFALSLFAQQTFVEQSLVINIEVPVRIFQGDRFVENLTLNDFELFEDGVAQKIDAVYLVKKRSIERSNENKRFTPETTRNFFLFFEVADYMPKIGESIEFFIQNVILPGDILYIVTPMKTYRMRDRALELKSKEDISTQITSLLKKDCTAGNSEYRNTVREITELTKSLSASIQETDTLDPTRAEATNLPRLIDSVSQDYSGLELDEQLFLYSGMISKLDMLRRIDQMRMLDFARILKNKPGQKYVYLFHQEEYIPRIEPKILNQFANEHQQRPDVIQTLAGIEDFYRRDTSLDIDLVKRSYADASISIHFLFVRRPPENVFNIRMQPHSEDVYQAFREIVQATGGYFEASANPVVSLRKAVEASENYYLLYYTPKNYTGDGKFKSIEVKVKGKNYRITHRAGYFAN